MRRLITRTGALGALLALAVVSSGSGAPPPEAPPSGVTPECPPGGAETLAIAQKAMTATSAGAVASRRRVGVGHLGPADVRPLRDPADSEACRTIRSMPVVMGWVEAAPNPNAIGDDVERGYFAVGDVYFVAAHRDPVVVLPSGDFRVRTGPGPSVGVISQRGEDLGRISF